VTGSLRNDFGDQGERRPPVRTEKEVQREILDIEQLIKDSQTRLFDLRTELQAITLGITPS
jgi:uncharacterized protein YeeX (DUF496 family)